MSKHTEGPWRCVGTYVSKVLRPNGYSLPICRVYNQKSGSPGVEPDMSLEEAEANALLIAATPDLLAACVEALALICEFEVEALDGRDHVPDQLRDAIAKATGAARPKEPPC